jgi:hypothetical protein
MTTQQARAIIAKYPNAISFVRKSHLEELTPVCEVHIEVIEATKDDFVDMGTVKGVTTYYPHKQLTDKIGNAAGISFAGDPQLIQLPSGAWLGKAIPQELGPDGKMVQWAPANYEFNPADRAEEEWLRKHIKYKDPLPSEVEQRLKILELKKVAARRADTGARVAAIVSAIGMPTGFKGIFQNGASQVVFLFSRIIVNTKNEMVMQYALSKMFGAAAAVAGPSINTPAIAAPAAPQVDDYAGQYEPVPDEPMDDREGLIRALKDIRLRHDKILPQEAKNQIDSFLANEPQVTTDNIRVLLGRCAAYLQTKGVVL